MAIGIITGSGTYALPGFEGREPEPVDTRWGRRSSRAERSRASRSCTSPATAQARPAVQPRHAPREHRALQELGVDGVLAVTVCGARRPGRRARLARRVRRPALPRQPAGRRLAVHVPRRARRPAARALDLRGPYSPALRAALLARGRGGRPHARRRGATAMSTGRASTRGRRSAGSRAAGVTAVSQTAGPETVLCGRPSCRSR